MTNRGALQDLVVAEIGARGAVKVAGSLLRQLGATVVAIETDAAATGAVRRAQQIAGKLSVKLDDAAGADRDLAARLAARADIVLTSSDVDPPWLRPPARPDTGAVVCDVTAFGHGAAWAGRPLSEVAVQALSGIMDTTGFPDGPPVPIRVPVLDYVAGVHAVSASLAAQRVRRRTGHGQSIDIALFDGAFASLRTFLLGVLSTEDADPSRLGNRHPTVRPWNLYETRDSHVLICAGNTFAMFERLCSLVGRPDIAPKYRTQASRVAGTPEIDAAIEGWTRRFTTRHCVDEMLAVGVVSGPLIKVDDHPRERNLDHRQMIRRVSDPLSGSELYLPGSPLRMSETPGAAPTRVPGPDEDREAVAALARDVAAPVRGGSLRPGERPLDGVRVVEFGQYTTAPMCARELAFLGAEVIKVEQPTAGEARSGASISFLVTNADKRTMVIDLNEAGDREVLARLLGTSDVLVENLKPGTLAKFGFGPDAIRDLNPRLIYCPISGFGLESLYATRPAFDMVITAMAGFMTVLSADGVPLKSGISTADFMGGTVAVAAILAALEHADRTGRGQLIDLSMQDITAWLTQAAWNGALDEAVQPAVVRAADGYVLVEAGPPALDALRHAGVLPEATAGMSRVDLVRLLAENGVEAVPVQTVREAAMMPHTRERRLWFMMRGEDGAECPMLSSPLRLAATPPLVRHLALPMNHDRRAILAELGLPAGGVAPNPRGDRGRSAAAGGRGAG